MNTEGIDFPLEDGYWDAGIQAIIFYAVNDETRIKCGISRIALVDFFHTEDTKDKALELFKENKKRVNRIAEMLIQEDRFNEDGGIFIKYEDCEHYGL